MKEQVLQERRIRIPSRLEQETFIKLRYLSFLKTNPVYITITS